MSKNNHNAAKRTSAANYIAALQQAKSAAQIETIITERAAETFCNILLTKIAAARIEADYAVCDAHPLGSLIPRQDGPYFNVGGQRLRIGKRPGAIGWAYAERWATGILLAQGIHPTTVSTIIECWAECPHRCLLALEAAEGSLAHKELAA